MAIVYKNAQTFFGGIEITGVLNQVALDYSAAPLDATVFGNNTRVMKGGLKDAKATGRGFWVAGANQVDPVLYDAVGVADSVLTIFPNGITEGSTSTGFGYAFKTVQGNLKVGGAIGDLLPFDFEALGRGVSA